MSFTQEDFAQALEKYDISFQRGDVVKGRITRVDRDAAFVDIGGKALGRLPLDEVIGATDLTKVLEKGEKREFLIVREQDADGEVLLSLRRLALKRAWETAQESCDQGAIITATVTKINRGGVVVDLDGLRGFVPRSHLRQPEAMETLVGQALTLAYLEVDFTNKRLVLSERKAQRNQGVREFTPGQLIDGEVTGAKDFGLFVAFQGTTGLLHVRDISQNFVENPAAVFPKGTIIKAVVTRLDEAKGRINLSTRVLEKSPGEILENAAQVFEDAEKRAIHYRSQLEQGKTDA